MTSSKLVRVSMICSMEEKICSMSSTKANIAATGSGNVRSGQGHALCSVGRAAVLCLLCNKLKKKCKKSFSATQLTTYSRREGSRMRTESNWVCRVTDAVKRPPNLSVLVSVIKPIHHHQFIIMFGGSYLATPI